MIGRAEVRALLQAGAGAHVSILMPAERAFPASQQNAVRFRNLLREVEQSLAQESTYALDEAGRTSLLAPLHQLAAARETWAHPEDGLAVYRNEQVLHVHWLPMRLPELAVVAGSFHVKPLLRFTQRDDGFHVLALHADRLRLYQGNRRELRELDAVPAVPRTLEDALGSEIDELDSDTYSYDAGPGVRGQQMSRTGGGARAGSNAQATDKDLERFFRAADREVARHYSQPSGLPLILAALPQYHALFRRVSGNPLLAAHAIDVNPESLSTDELRQRAWYALQPHFDERVQDLVERFGAARAGQRGDDRLQELATAAAAGRIEILLVEQERHIPGRMDATSGAFVPLPMDDPEADDLLDDIAERVLLLGGEVVVLDAERMPSTTGLAAIYRF